MEQTQEVIAFKAQFKPEEFEILAVTDSSGWGGFCSQGEKFYTASTCLIAWKLLGSAEVQRGFFQLETKADQAYLTELREAAPSDHIIRVTVRQDQDRFLVCSKPTTAEDEHLAEILAEYLKTVYYEDAVLGRFELDRSVNFFEGFVTWNEQKVHYYFDNGGQERNTAALQVMHNMLSDAASWDQKIRTFAAQSLLDLKNDEWLDEDEEPLTMEEFSSRLKLQSIDTDYEGQFNFWFDDDDIFWGHSVVVTGTLQDGLQEANMEG